MADDDIDDLLAEVGAAVDSAHKAGTVSSVKLRSAHPSEDSSVRGKTSSIQTSNPLDELLAMTEDTGGSTSVPAPRPSQTVGGLQSSSSNRATLSQGSQVQRCDPVYVGECSDRPGRSPCPSLRCTACDFPVLLFPHATWPAEVNYMFFRNHCPDRAKLAVGMGKEQGAVAYCCQCSWLSLHAGEGLHAVRRGAVPVPPNAGEWKTGIDAGRVEVGGGGWASWTCSGSHS